MRYFVFIYYFSIVFFIIACQTNAPLSQVYLPLDHYLPSLAYETKAGNHCIEYSSDSFYRTDIKITQKQSTNVTLPETDQFPYVYVEFRYRVENTDHGKLKVNDRKIVLSHREIEQFYAKSFLSSHLNSQIKLEWEGQGELTLYELRVKPFSYCERPKRLCTRVDRVTKHLSVSGNTKNRREAVFKLPYTLGKQETLILRSRRTVPNLPGYDLSIALEGNNVGLEVFTSHWPEGPWNYLGNLKASGEMDISPLANTRFLKFINRKDTVIFDKITCVTLPL